MGKVILKGTLAIAALAISSASVAGPSDKVVYSNNIGAAVANVPVLTSSPAGQIVANVADSIRPFLPADAQGARYAQSSTVAGNTETASVSRTAQFTLSGTVDRDCSFYAGESSTQAINLGTIGVRTGNNDSVSIAFNQAGPITASVNSSTAGCNTQNQITITKGNGNSGLLNSAAVSYDSAQFTNKIPYSVSATWQGVPLGAPTGGTQQTLSVAATDAFKAVQVGAWRSSFTMNVNAPAQSLGLIAGTYTDTITVELRAL